ncbi:wax ester/triacylglycerol synthase domain-containing protein [Mycolicibacterium gilvum]|uniref:Diacylglycerol O-acyltransferase n=1 Tax=Mycolicibacterium gilvum TaxID=1804 RepID=A0A379MMG5_9MYCO|nr:wax ester/triacylglycerol synthase domain-containing protein [Mycolicibacterium gilvum]SUE32818.1 diacylglycerol O-acyltransferase [Mycolicibacterium gilvum]
MVHLSHAVTDGVGGVEMFANLYDFEREPPPQPVPPMPVPTDLSPNDLMRSGLNRLPGTIVGGWSGGRRCRAGRGPRRSRPGRAARQRLRLREVRCGAVGPVADPSPILRRRSLSSRSEAIDIEFSDLHRASKAAEGSINDAYLAGLCGALRLYHESMGVPVDTLPMAVPVNLRSDADPAGATASWGSTSPHPSDCRTPRCIKEIRAQMRSKRDERALDVVGAIAPLVSLLPDSVLETMAGSIVNSDVQASNVPVYAGDTFIAGAKVLRQYGLGPLPGVAMMVVLISRSGYCTISTRYDRASITDPGLLAQCLLDGFDEVLALGGDGRAVPATFSRVGAQEK